MKKLKNLKKNDNENARNVGVAKVLARRKQVTEESANNYDCPMYGTAAV